MITIDHVSKGMLVVDSQGHEIGKISHVEAANVKIADFEHAASASSQDPINLMLTAIFGMTPRVPKEMSSRLFRSGFVKISGHGLLSGSHFASFDAIDHVDQNRIHLNCSLHHLDAL